MATKTSRSQLKELADRGLKLGAALNVSVLEISNGQFEATCSFKTTSEGPTIEGIFILTKGTNLQYK